MARPRKNPLQPVEAVAVPEVVTTKPVEAVAGGDAVTSIPGMIARKVRLTALYAYWGDDGNLRRWSEGAEVTDPAEIADLVKRGAPVEEV